MFIRIDDSINTINNIGICLVTIIHRWSRTGYCAEEMSTIPQGFCFDEIRGFSSLRGSAFFTVQTDIHTYML